MTKFLGLTALLTVLVMGVVVFGYWGILTPTLLKLIEAGQPDLGNSQSGVLAMAITLAVIIMLILWSLLSLVVRDPGFVTSEVLDEAYTELGISRSERINWDHIKLCAEMSYRYLDSQDLICSPELLDKMEKPKNAQTDAEIATN